MTAENWTPHKEEKGTEILFKNHTNTKKSSSVCSFISMFNPSPATEPVNYAYLQKEGNKNNVVSTC